jgi:hypothetical protein
MSISLIERDISSPSEREERAQRLATLFIGEMVPLLVQVRQDFYDKKTDELIFGCRTWEDYCQSVLQYSKRHINRLIQGQNPATKFDGSQNRKPHSPPTLESLPVPSQESLQIRPVPESQESPQAAPTVKCPDCGGSFDSISATIRHAKQEHGLLGTDVAAFKRKMLGKTETPEFVPAILRINKHLIGVKVGDKVLYNTSSGASTAEVVEVDDENIVIQTGKSEKTRKTFPLTVDCDTIRSSTRSQSLLAPSRSLPDDDESLTPPQTETCTLTEKNIGDTRCLSMAKYRLDYTEGKVELLLHALRHPEELNKDKEVRKTLKVYLGAYRDFENFLIGGIVKMESEFAQEPPDKIVPRILKNINSAVVGLSSADKAIVFESLKAELEALSEALLANQEVA